jgi:von Willebrand factor type D domain
MTPTRSTVRNVAQTLPAIAAACLLSCFVPAMTTSAAPADQKGKPPEKSNVKSPEARLRAQWQKDITRVPVPKKGCFTATYPSREWKEVPCVTAPTRPFLPASGRRPYNIGNGTGVSADVTGFQISSVVGSFDTVSPSTTVTSNAFSLQINTRPFTTSVCGGAADCKGWQQFIYSQTGCTDQSGSVSVPCVFVQYWLLNKPTCPTGWTTYGPHCSMNSSAGGASLVTADQLHKTTLTATVSATQDSAVLASPGGPAFAMGADSVLKLSGSSEVVEFNAFGDGNSSAVNFSPSTTQLVPRISITDGSNKKPGCLPTGFTAETNNLNFGPGAPTASGTGPALLINESVPGGAMGCAAATSIGDTHLTTFGGTLYDFQASGDFILLQTTQPEFVVQARQVSGSPNWPNASINKAVGVQMGKTRVAICLPPAGLVIDGKPTEIKEDTITDLPDGADISRRGNIYILRDAAGNSLRATVNDPYIDVTVGLGRWPTDARGVLANARGNANLIAARDGAVVSAPFPFETLYHHYADSWRVRPPESVLDACGEPKAEPGLPRRPFFANDLPAEIYKKARAVCTSAGVKIKSLLDACTLDVAVIGHDSAAKVYVGMRAPSAVGNTGSGRDKK